MKIYFDGASTTEGRYLATKHGVVDWKEKRWTGILANKLGAEQYNFAIGGGSNQRILRNITTEHDISDYDLAVILMSREYRTEFFWNVEYIPVSPNKKEYGTPEISKFWECYYKTILDEQYAMKYDEVIYKSIRAICAVNNVPLVLMSDSKKTKLPFDIRILSKAYEHYQPLRDKDNHPTLDAHSKIADDIINFINITSVL